MVSVAAFKSLSLVCMSWTTVCLGVKSFVFILLAVYSLEFGENLTITSSNISLAHSLSLCLLGF